MGSTISYNVGFERKDSQQKPKNGRRQKQRRRDSVNRPVLKLQICSNTMERQHRINGETSLDHPFLKRLDSRKYGNADDLTNPLFLDPVSEESISHLQHHSIDSSTPTSSIAANITVNNGVRTSTTTTTINRNGTIPRSLSIPGRDSTTSTSMIVVQFVDNDNGQRNTKMEYDHLCLMKYGRIESEETEISTPTGSVQSNDDTASGHLSYPELRQRIFDHTHPNKKVELEPDSRCSRSQSTNDISKVRIGRQASVTINRRITHATSLQNQLDQCSSLDIEVLMDEGDWSFGENIMRCLEEEGIVLFNIEDPQTSSELEVEETWPNLKHKMKQWRSEQSLLDII